jgi:hypothetical protein
MSPSVIGLPEQTAKAWETGPMLQPPIGQIGQKVTGACRNPDDDEHRVHEYEHATVNAEPALGVQSSDGGLALVVEASHRPLTSSMETGRGGRC